MRELALHLLDVMENAVRAQATVVRVSVLLESDTNLLRLSVEDDGPGLPVAPEHALDPFYTTKKGKRTGLGLSLFKAAAQQARGDLALSESEFAGVKVEAWFEYNHLDRTPLGDVAASIETLAISNPDIIWVCHIEGPGGEETLILQDLIVEHPDMSLFQVLALFARRVRQALAAAQISTG